MADRSVADGRLVLPAHWPRWAMRCGAKRERDGVIIPCRKWAVIGMPTCTFHGSGGETNRNHGQLRYLCWIIIGGPQKGISTEQYCRVALAAAFSELIAQGKGSVDQQLKAALWLTDALSKGVMEGLGSGRKDHIDDLTETAVSEELSVHKTLSRPLL